MAQNTPQNQFNPTIAALTDPSKNNNSLSSVADGLIKLGAIMQNNAKLADELKKSELDQRATNLQYLLDIEKYKNYNDDRNLEIEDKKTKLGLFKKDLKAILSLDSLKL